MKPIDLEKLPTELVEDESGATNFGLVAHPDEILDLSVALAIARGVLNPEDTPAEQVKPDPARAERLKVLEEELDSMIGNRLAHGRPLYLTRTTVFPPEGEARDSITLRPGPTE